MASLPTSPDGLLYAALQRRIDTEVPSIAGKLWLLRAPATKPAAYALLIPISGTEAQSESGPAGLRTKVLQIQAITSDAEGIEPTLQLRAALDLALTNQHWEDTIGPNTVAIEGSLPAGDGYEDYDPDTRQYIALFRLEIKYRITTAA